MINPRRQPRQRQQGAIAIFVALGISVMISVLAILDIGFLYYYKRDYQKAADLAAMAGAEELRAACSDAQNRATTSAQTNLGINDEQSIVPECGVWEKGDEDIPPSFTLDTSEDRNALRVTVSGTPPRFLIPGERTISAYAIAMEEAPKAALSLRSTLATVSTEQSALLDAVVGGLLGGSIDLGVAGWNGLLGTEIGLLDYLDALAVEAGVTVGDYDELLAVENLSVGDLLQVALDVLPQDGTAEAAISALNDLVALGLDVQPLGVGLGELLDVATGTGESGLDTQLNLFELVNGSAQLANGDQIVDVDLPVETGLVNARIRIATKETGTVFAAGNPATSEVSVRAANARALVDLDLEGISAISGVLDALVNLLNSTGLLQGLVDTLDGLLSLNLVATVGSLLDLIGDLLGSLLGGGNCGDGLPPCEAADLVYAELVNPPKLSIAIDLGGGSARVADYLCGGTPSRTLDVEANTEAGSVSIGKVANPDDFLDLTRNPPGVQPVTLIEVGTRRARPLRCRGFLGIYNCGDGVEDTEWYFENEGTGASGWQVGQAGKDNAKTTVIAGVQLSIGDEPLLGSEGPLYYENSPDEEDLPEMGDPPKWRDLTTKDIVGSVGNTLDQVNVELVSDPGFGGGMVSVLAGIVETLLDDVASLLAGPLSGVLDPILSALLETLGVQLAQSEIGANLSCSNGGAILVE